MTTASTARFDLPLLEPGQAQKEMFHNEALVRLDLLSHTVVESGPIDVPPAAPEPGQCWLIGPAPSGAWEGRAGCLAGWTAAGWRFVAPREGLRIWIAETQSPAQFVAGQWYQDRTYGKVFIQGRQVVGEMQPGIAEPNGGVTVDQEARRTISAVLDALRVHGLIDAG
ncbi:DUF2793 domain-containing protein [Sphingomonas sp. HT-1]|uniref:DUF2793 domain-containing protein n=1 Tax=unclassified Sphingomonas TaxID=196159 RepID=UPI000308467F|nr:MULTISPECIES: DUF2793 domain-containing protein [unclassified Sphingomonas]KTF69808.1 hypothetical protein ATB93_07130 [Sphingomonas sp. WG]